MRRAVLVELTRLRWRRAVVILLAACVVLPLLVLVGVAWSTRPVSDADLAAAQAQADREAALPSTQDALEDCVEDPESWFGGPVEGDLREMCEQAVLPRAEWYLNRSPLDPSSMVTDYGTAVPVIVSVLLLLAGATYVGADWNTGSMSNQLLFEPRRGRVFAAKATALAIVAAVTAIAVQAVVWIFVAVLAATRDVPLGDHFWSRLVPGVTGRGMLLVVGAALLGLFLTMLFRSTVVTLGIVFTVAIAGTIVIAALPLGGHNERWMLPTNVSAFVQHGAEYFNSQQLGGVTCTTAADGTSECTGTETLTVWGAAAYLLTLVLASAAAALATFRLRDVP